MKRMLISKMRKKPTATPHHTMSIHNTSGALSRVDEGIE
jgi:hypothetical protein